MNIFERKLELKKFLEEHPELKPLQEKIDLELAKAGSQENRMKVAYNMMMESLRDLQKALEK